MSPVAMSAEDHTAAIQPSTESPLPSPELGAVSPVPVAVDSPPATTRAANLSPTVANPACANDSPMAPATGVSSTRSPAPQAAAADHATAPSAPPRSQPVPSSSSRAAATPGSTTAHPAAVTPSMASVGHGTEAAPPSPGTELPAAGSSSSNAPAAQPRSSPKPASGKAGRRASSGAADDDEVTTFTGTVTSQGSEFCIVSNDIFVPRYLITGLKMREGITRLRVRARSRIQGRNKWRALSAEMAPTDAHDQTQTQDQAHHARQRQRTRQRATQQQPPASQPSQPTGDAQPARRRPARGSGGPSTAPGDQPRAESPAANPQPPPTAAPQQQQQELQPPQPLAGPPVAPTRRGRGRARSTPPNMRWELMIPDPLLLREAKTFVGLVTSHGQEFSIIDQDVYVPGYLLWDIPVQPLVTRLHVTAVPNKIGRNHWRAIAVQPHTPGRPRGLVAAVPAPTLMRPASVPFAPRLQFSPVALAGDALQPHLAMPGAAQWHTAVFPVSTASGGAVHLAPAMGLPYAPHGQVHVAAAAAAGPPLQHAVPVAAMAPMAHPAAAAVSDDAQPPAFQLVQGALPHDLVGVVTEVAQTHCVVNRSHVVPFYLLDPALPIVPGGTVLNVRAVQVVPTPEQPYCFLAVVAVHYGITQQPYLA